MFNAALSNAAGVFIAPVLLSLLLQETGKAVPISVLWEITISLSWTMLLPLMIGQLLQFRYMSCAVAVKRLISMMSNILILLIVLLAIAKASSNPGFISNLLAMKLALPFLAVSHYLLILLALGLGKLLRFDDWDMASIGYAAPQKTLAMGAPLLTTYFAEEPTLLGIALLPILFFHPWQIINAGFLKYLPFNRHLSDATETG